MQLNSTPSIDARQLSTGGAAATSAAEANYDAFLRLLIAEMKNQDPTKPVDPTQMVTQLATFSQVEQSVQMNARLDALLTNFGLTQAASLVGKTISPVDGAPSGVVRTATMLNGVIVVELEDGRTLPVVQGTKIS